MFKNTHGSGARRLARVVFGLVLIGFGITIAARALANNSRDNDVPMANLVGTAWVIAALASVATYLVLRVLPVRLKVALGPSLALPGMGIVLVLPITVQLVVGGYASQTHVGGFADWVRMSVYFTGLAHIVGAAAVAVRARGLARGESAIPSLVIYAMAVGAANIPFPILPAIYTAATGIVVLPFVWALAPLARWERASDGLPEMIVL